MHKIQISKLSKIEIQIDIDFRFENLHVYTFGYADYIKQWNRGKKDNQFHTSDRFLVFEGQCEIESYDSVMEADVKLRPEFLGVLGILTFFTGESFTVFQFDQHRNFAINSFWETSNKNRFIYYGDKSQPLAKVLQFLSASDQTKRALVFSLLDRYRKACFMANESKASLVYSDESFLAYFHILELLASQFESTLKNTIKGSIKSFLNSLLADVYLYSNTRISNELTSKQNLIEQLFIPEIPISVKICHMYNELKMFDEKSRQIVEGFVKFRNDIAHGRAVFNRKLLFPLPPFFQQVKDIDKEIGMMSLVAARTIDVYLGSGLYTSQWTSYLKQYPASLEEIKEFLKEKKYEKLTKLQFEKGQVFKVAPWMLSYYYFYHKISSDDYEAALSGLIIEFPLEKKNIKAYLEPCIMLSDSRQEQIRDKARLVIRTAFANRYTKMRARDYLKELERRFPLIWFKSFVSE